jgi:lysophospholipid acyltransferase (LPLAT)-like uncharacterized protein
VTKGRRRGPLRRAFKVASRALALRVVPIFAFALFLVARTWRVRVVNYGWVKAEHANGRGVIYAFGHGRMLPCVWTHRHRGVRVLVSEHFDGELITRVIGCFGFKTARGSATRGGARALRELVRDARRGDLAVTPDGPKGPFLTVKPGLPFLAARTGSAICAASFDADSRIEFGSWDKFRLPLPGATVFIVAAPPRTIASESSQEELEGERRALEQDLERCEREAMALARRPARERVLDADLVRPDARDAVIRRGLGPLETRWARRAPERRFG